MLDRQKGDFVFQCEACGEILETRTGSFDSARNILRREGWRARKDDSTGEWEHFCSRCRATA